MKKIKLAKEEDKDQKTLVKEYKRLEIFIIIFMVIAICLGTFYFNVICFGTECENKSPAPLIIINTDKTNTNSEVIEEDKLPEWAEYLLSQNIKEIAVYNRKKDESFNPGDSCPDPEYITKEQLKSILKEMTKSKLSKYVNASGFGGVCVKNILVKYNDTNQLEIYDFKYIIPKDNSIKSLLEKEQYTEDSSMKGREEFDDWYSYDWDTSYIDALLG